MSTREIIYAAAGGSAAPTYIEDVFSTYLYTGNETARTITNGIDLTTNGGLVWCKSRNTVSTAWHNLFDTARGNNKALYTNNTDASTDYGAGAWSPATTGFNLGDAISAPGLPNRIGDNYVSWTFREQPKFFDIVTWTGNGGTQNISHSLNSVPGMIWVKRTNASSNWVCYHRSLPSGYILYPNDIAAQDNFGTIPQGTFGNNSSPVAPTSTQFTIGNQGTVNASGGTYVAYLFAHDAGGFGLTGTDNVISCGSFTGDSTVTLGYEPQWIMFKRTDSTGNWRIIDNMRGMPVIASSTGSQQVLFPNTSGAESTDGVASPTATGFQTFLGGGTYIYMAIRRGPMKTPTVGTSVYQANAYTGNGTANTTVAGNFGFPVDLMLLSSRSANALSWAFYAQIAFDRLRGVDPSLGTALTSSEITGWTGYHAFNVQNSIGWGLYGTFSGTGYLNNSGGTWVARGFQRAPGFFDIVCYSGNSVNGQTYAHNLGVTPELVIIKARNSVRNWPVYPNTLSGSLYLNLDGSGYGTRFTSMSATTFGVSNDETTNFSGITYVAYLFATVAGVSKVGSYTGTGGTQTINAGLPTGARFVLIKRTDSTGDWWVWDTARGMVAGTDPRLALNSTAAEINNDWVYTVTNGFQIVTTDATVNASGGSYIYLAIA